jgi:hypothetical protein
MSRDQAQAKLAAWEAAVSALSPSAGAR